jgi:hypothetical protein
MGCCEVELPEPFSAVAQSELIRAIYPDYNSETRRLGPRVKGADGKPRAGQLYDAALWKGSTEPRLLVLIETYAPEQGGARPEYGAAGFGLDLAAFGLEAGRPKLIAKLKDAETHSGHSEMSFDQAPYRVTTELRAFGLRETYLHMGHRTERLKLFIQDGAEFRAIFERPMLDSLQDATADPLEGDLDAEKMKEIYQDDEPLAFHQEAILHVVSGQAGANEFKITERRKERRADGTLAKETRTELWSWDASAQTFTKRS